MDWLVRVVTLCQQLGESRWIIRPDSRAECTFGLPGPFGLLFRGLGTFGLFLENDRDDVVIAAIVREDQRGRRIAMRIDAAPRVRTATHEQPNHVRQSI